MAYNGYWRLGDTEIANGPRAAKYAGGLMPQFGIEDCDDCDGLAEALGHAEYRSPGIDGAPWVNTNDRLLDDFWGVYPLGVTGADDGTRTSTVTELIQDGAVVSPSRNASREMLFNVLLVGKQKANVEAGLRWLDGALDAVRCGGTPRTSCTGETLHFYSACPPSCDHSACEDNGEVDWGVPPQPERINWVYNPRGIVGGDPLIPEYTATSGGGVVSQAPSGLGVRLTYPAGATLDNTGVLYSQGYGFVAPQYDGPASLPAGQPFTGIISEISVPSPDIQWRLHLRLTNDTDTVADVYSPVQTGSTSYFDVEAIALNPTGEYHSFAMIVEIMNAVAEIEPGDTFDFLRWGAEAVPSIASLDPRYFDGTYGPSVALSGRVAYWSAPEGEGFGPSILSAAPDPLNLWYVDGGSHSTDLNPFWGQGFASENCTPPSNLHIAAQGQSFRTLTLVRAMPNLIPGQWYRVEATAAAAYQYPVIGFPPQVTMQVRGHDESLLLNTEDVDCATEQSAALWFQARSQVEYLEFSLPPVQSTTPGVSTLLIYNLSVLRSTQDSEVYSTTFTYDGSLLNGWDSPTGNANFSVVIDRESSGVWIDKPTVTFTDLNTTHVIPNGRNVVRRDIRGLIPGLTYTARIKTAFSASLAQVPDVQLRMNEGTSQIQSLVDGETYVFEITFQAVANSQALVLEFAGDYEFTGSSGWLKFTLVDALVERAWMSQDEVPYPNPGLLLERRLFQVTAVSGPTVVEEYDRDCGYMVRVTFGLVAGVPDQYGQFLFAGNALGGTSFEIEDVPCINGRVSRFNYVPNPSFEVDLAGWTSFGGVTPGRNEASYLRNFWRSYGRKEGTFVWYGVATGGSQTAGLRTTATQVVTPGQYVGVRALVAHDAMPFPSSGGARLRILWSTGAYTSTPYRHALQPGGYQFDLTAVAPAGATNFRVEVEFYSGRTTKFIPILRRMWVDRVWAVKGDSRNDVNMQLQAGYFDGDSYGGAWTGTPNNSISEFAEPTATAVLDPDCPPMPFPPQPPPIINLCIADPATWDRYVIDVADDDVPMFASSVPVVTVTTGSVEARAIRIRWWDNPTGEPVDLLDPCSYMAETIVSYMPKNAVLVIDGISKTATVTQGISPAVLGLTNAQFAYLLATSQNFNPGDMVTQTATHLLYGPDGGPLQWPELDCNQRYTMTVDVDSTTTVEDLDVNLLLGVKF